MLLSSDAPIGSIENPFRPLPPPQRSALVRKIKPKLGVVLRNTKKRR